MHLQAWGLREINPDASIIRAVSGRVVEDSDFEVYWSSLPVSYRRLITSHQILLKRSKFHTVESVARRLYTCPGWSLPILPADKAQLYCGKDVAMQTLILHCTGTIDR